jgi:hypothetical protein
MKIGTEGWQLGPHVSDHRGNRTRLRREKYWWNFDKPTRKAMKKADWYKQVATMSGLYGATLGISFFLIRYTFHLLGFTSKYTFLISMIFAFCAGQFVSMFRYRPMLEWIAGRRLGMCQCASCQYALDGILPEPDGCTVCPECGAAWKLSPSDEG